MENWLAFILPPIIGALIGAVTNDVAIRMLFRPYGARYIGSLRVPFTPGLIPRERHHIAEAIADTFVAHVFNGEDLGKLFLNDQVKDKISSKIKDMIAQVGGLLNVNEAMLGMASTMASAQMLDELGKLAEELDENSDDIKARIKETIDNLDVATLEALVMGFSRKQFRHITWFGALLGFIIGLVQVVVFQVLVIA